MYGHGAPPSTPSAAMVITQRVLYAAAGVLCCGLLACVPLFRVAFLRGRLLDWAVAWVSIPMSIACLSVIGALPESDRRTDVALAAVLLLGAVSAAYYLIVDIRLHRRPHPYAGQMPPSPHAATVHGPGGHTPYGYPQQGSPYAPTPVPHTTAPPTPVPHTTAPPTPVPHTTAPPTPVPPSQSPQHPGPARIDQVRAELDELSDYLRRQDGQQGNHEGGR
ncbi:membrane protein [Streptomyces caelestis]|uniref:Membrane protein n=2 Tax=Streptomyces TaxID=1883 RepID=A0A0M8QQ79_9ACTN|nr:MULTISPECIES: hypothetical protein [Streptomyces]KOT36667.1 membrane protein [Streptomyces caelestis]